MNDSKLIDDLPKLKDDGACDHLKNMKLPNISLPNQDGNLLKLKRLDTFRIVIFFYSLTGHPQKKLPKNWNTIPGAAGCTLETCSFRDNYENLIQLNSIPIGISTQSVDHINEMTTRLMINYDILSDINLIFSKNLNLPTFSINNQIFIKRLTIIVEKNIIKKVFYPIFLPNKHINEVLKWLKNN